MSSYVNDLKVPPANRLEKLKGSLNYFYSIRINDQWRVIFRWVNGILPKHEMKSGQVSTRSENSLVPMWDHGNMVK
jgi:plasmid maintenance system killer protein